MHPLLSQFPSPGACSSATWLLRSKVKVLGAWEALGCLCSFFTQVEPPGTLALLQVLPLNAMQPGSGSHAFGLRGPIKLIHMETGPDQAAQLVRASSRYTTVAYLVPGPGTSSQSMNKYVEQQTNVRSLSLSKQTKTYPRLRI